MEGNVGVGLESLSAPLVARDNGFGGAGGQPAKASFPKEMPSLLLGLSAQMNLDCDHLANRLLSRNAMFPTNHVKAKQPSVTQSSPAAAALWAGQGAKPDQLPFNNGLIFFSNSSSEVSPLTFSPLMKNVGVESTFNTSLAYF